MIIVSDGMGHGTTTKIRRAAESQNVVHTTIVHKSSSWDPRLRDAIEEANKRKQEKLDRLAQEAEEARRGSPTIRLAAGVTTAKVLGAYMWEADRALDDDDFARRMAEFFKGTPRADQIVAYAQRVQQTSPLPDFGTWLKQRGGFYEPSYAHAGRDWDGKAPPVIEVSPPDALSTPVIEPPPPPPPTRDPSLDPDPVAADRQVDDRALDALLSEAATQVQQETIKRMEAESALAAAEQKLEDERQALADRQRRLLAATDEIAALRRSLFQAEERIKALEAAATTPLASVLAALKLLHKQGILTGDEVLAKLP